MDAVEVVRWGAKVGPPPKSIQAVVPYEVVHSVKLPSHRSTIVEHRAKEPLSDRLEAPDIMDTLYETRGEPSACALPADRDPGGVYFQAVSFALQPVPTSQAVIYR